MAREAGEGRVGTKRADSEQERKVGHGTAFRAHSETLKESFGFNHGSFFTTNEATLRIRNGVP